jgi:hypothetical protein
MVYLTGSEKNNYFDYGHTTFLANHAKSVDKLLKNEKNIK